MDQKVAYLFPGQGSQSVGMCKGLYEHSVLFRDVIQEVEDASYCKLWPIIQEGPERELKKTLHCQLALFAVSLATLKVMQFERPHLKPTYCAGLSLGEYTALVASGVMKLKEAADLVAQRARFMQQACEKTTGKMMAILGLDFQTLSDLVAKYPLNKEGAADLAVANYNAPHQIVVSGTPQAIEWCERQAKAAGGKRFIELEVSGAFHSPLMHAASEALRPVIATARFEYSPIKVVSNVTAMPVAYSDDFYELLVQQVTHPVLWAPTIQHLDSLGVTTYIEVGPGRVLQGLNRRIGTMAKTLSVETVEDIGHLP